MKDGAAKTISLAEKVQELYSRKEEWKEGWELEFKVPKVVCLRIYGKAIAHLLIQMVD